MKKITEIRSRNLRKERNSELVRRMRNGEQLSSFSSTGSWFPPRPTIEKDKTAINKLYGQTSVQEITDVSMSSSEVELTPLFPVA